MAKRKTAKRKTTTKKSGKKFPVVPVVLAATAGFAIASSMNKTA